MLLQCNMYRWAENYYYFTCSYSVKCESYIISIGLKNISISSPTYKIFENSQQLNFSYRVSLKHSSSGNKLIWLRWRLHGWKIILWRERREALNISSPFLVRYDRCSAILFDIERWEEIIEPGKERLHRVPFEIHLLSTGDSANFWKPSAIVFDDARHKHVEDRLADSVFRGCVECHPITNGFYQRLTERKDVRLEPGIAVVFEACWENVSYLLEHRRYPSSQ